MCNSRVKESMANAAQIDSTGTKGEGVRLAGADANSLLESTLTFVPRPPGAAPSPRPAQVVSCPSQPRPEAAS
jgi:hypothetical protein